jgi:hypothetical protein
MLTRMTTICISSSSSSNLAGYVVVVEFMFHIHDHWPLESFNLLYRSSIVIKYCSRDWEEPQTTFLYLMMTVAKCTYLVISEGIEIEKYYDLVILEDFEGRT